MWGEQNFPPVRLILHSRTGESLQIREKRGVKPLQNRYLSPSLRRKLSRKSFANWTRLKFCRWRTFTSPVFFFEGDSVLLLIEKPPWKVNLRVVIQSSKNAINSSCKSGQTNRESFLLHSSGHTSGLLFP